MDFVLIQCIGAIAFILLILSYFKKEKSKILFMQILAYIMFTIHYYLLSGITGAICNFVGLIALITIYLFDKYELKNKRLVAYLFIIILLAINIATFQNVYSIFPMIASVSVIISFISNNEDFIRAIGVVSAICWLIYAIVYKSYISIVFESITCIGVVTAFIKNTNNKRISILNDNNKE